jgi:uncharacterized membrane protein YeaQ/YmgE (transglycosylase-associated protein family)
MLLLSWVALGFFAGIIASQLPRRSGTAAVPNIFVGVAGAIVGGWLFGVWAPHGVAEGVLLGSVAPACVGAVLFLVVYFAIGRRLGTAAA